MLFAQRSIPYITFFCTLAVSIAVILYFPNHCVCYYIGFFSITDTVKLSDSIFYSSLDRLYSSLTLELCQTRLCLKKAFTR